MVYESKLEPSVANMKYFLCLCNFKFKVSWHGKLYHPKWLQQDAVIWQVTTFLIESLKSSIENHSNTGLNSFKQSLGHDGFVYVSNKSDGRFPNKTSGIFSSPFGAPV